MKTAVMKVFYDDEKTKKKVMEAASGHSGVVSVSMDPKEMKLTVTGLINPVELVKKLTKYCYIDLLSVVTLPKKEEPAKVQKKVEPKKIIKKVEPKKIIKKVEPKKVQANKVANTSASPSACVIC